MRIPMLTNYGGMPGGYFNAAQASNYQNQVLGAQAQYAPLQSYANAMLPYMQAKYMPYQMQLQAMSNPMMWMMGEQNPGMMKGMMQNMIKLMPQGGMQGMAGTPSSAPMGGILGAFMLIRRDVISKIGFLDERFFLYCEDTDYCHRAYKKGWKIYYYPKITVKHLHGASTRRFRLKALILFHKGIKYFYNKHYRKKHGKFINSLVYCAIFIRFFIFFCLELISYLKSIFIDKNVQFSFDDEINA